MEFVRIILYIMKKDEICIFGGSGFIGSNFKKQYPNSIVIERNDNIPKTTNVLYCISTVDNYNVFSDPYLDINTNLIKLIAVLEECKKLNQESKVTFNFVSSWFVYGKTDTLPAKESSYCNPSGFYSITKYAAEKLLMSYCETFNINYRIFRLCNIIGNGDKKTSKKKNALQYMIDRVIMNESVQLYDDGTPIRDYMDVMDCCVAMKLCMDKGNLNEVYNISNSEPHKIRDIIEYVIQQVDSKSKLTSIETPNFHKIVQIKDMWLDNTKLLSLGYTPSLNVKQAVDKILEKYND